MLLIIIIISVRGGIYHSIYWYTKANNKYLNDYGKNKESSYLQYWDVNNLHGWAIWQKFSLNAFEWIKDNFQFNKDSRKSYNEKSDEGYFFEVDVQYTEKYKTKAIPKNIILSKSQYDLKTRY